MGVLNEAALVFAPKSGRVIILPVTTTAARYAIPADFRGVQCRWAMASADADIAFGDSSVVCTYAQASTVNSEAITPHVQSGGHLFSGVERHWVMPASDQATHFSVDGGGSGTLYIEAM